MNIDLEQIKNVVENHVGEPITGTERYRYLVDARKIYALISYRYSSKSLELIGKTIKRDHATIIHYVKNALKHIEFDLKFRETYQECLSGIPSIKNQDFYKEQYNYHLDRMKFYEKKIK